MEQSLLPKLAFKTLKSALEAYETTKTFDDTTITNLNCLFGEPFQLSTELLEKCKIIQYQTDDGLRNIYKISSNKEHYTIYSDINFCTCQNFKVNVLENQNSVTCKHVLAVKFGIVLGKVVLETVSEVKFAEFLNEQLNWVETEPE